MDEAKVLQVIVAVVVVFVGWILANLLAETGRRWILWHDLLRAHRSNRRRSDKADAGRRTSLTGATAFNDRYF